MNTDDFFEKLKPWSERKHRLLEKYLAPFSAKVASVTNNREVYCVDAFAGAAVYDDGRLGSPLLTARLADKCKDWRNPVNLRLINVEPDTENKGIFESLEVATREWKDRGVVQNIRSEFRPALAEILRTIGNQPALFFVDPFGPTQVHFSHLRPVLERTQRITELIINFDTDGLHRIARAALSPKTNSKAAETDARLVTAIVGSDRWLEEFRTRDFSTTEGEGWLLREYLGNLGTFDYEVVAYQIKESLRKRPQYHFVYCTRHADGIALMNDFMREEEDLVYDDHVEKDLPLFSDEASLAKIVDDRRRTLKVMIEIYLQQNSSTTRRKIKNEFLKMNFGQFHSRDFNSVVQELLNDGLLRETSGKTRINDDHQLVFSSLW